MPLVGNDPSPLDRPPGGPLGQDPALNILSRQTSSPEGDIISHWHTRKSISQQMREPYEIQWIKNWKSYRAYLESSPDPADWWRSNEFIPEMFNSIETILPRLLLGMFSKPEWFDVTCPHNDIPGHPGLSCNDYERLVKSLLLGGTRRMGLFQTAYIGHKYGTIMGHSWFKLRWEREPSMKALDVPISDPTTGEFLGMSSAILPTVSYDDPKLDWISNFRIWPDPTGQNEWFIEEIETTVEKLNALNARIGVYKNLGELGLMPSKDGTGGQPDEPRFANVAHGAPSSTGETQIAAVEGVSQTTRDESYDGQKVILLICSGRVGYEPTDGIKWRRTVIANDSIIIRDGANPTPDLRPEYFGVQSIPIPGFVYGDSVIRYAGPLNDQLNRIGNFRMDEVLLGIWQQYVYNRNAVTGNQFLMQPGGAIGVDAPDVRTAFAVLDRRPILPQAYQEAAVKQDQIERSTGATAIQQGATPADRETATSVGVRSQLGSERFRLSTMWHNMTFKKELLSRMFALYQRHLPPERLVRIVGEDFQVPVDLSMIQDGIDINIDADILELDTAQKQQAFAYFLQNAANPAFDPWWRKEALLRDAIEQFLQKDGRRYVRSDEEVQQILMAQFQAQVFANTSNTDGETSSSQSSPGSGGGGSTADTPQLPIGAFQGGPPSQ